MVKSNKDMNTSMNWIKCKNTKMHSKAIVKYTVSSKANKNAPISFRFNQFTLNTTKMMSTAHDQINTKGQELCIKLDTYTDALIKPRFESTLYVALMKVRRGQLHECAPEVRDAYHRSQRFLQALETLKGTLKVIRITSEISYEEEDILRDLFTTLLRIVNIWVPDRVSKTAEMIQEMQGLLVKYREDQKHEELISREAFDKLVAENAALLKA